MSNSHNFYCPHCSCKNTVFDSNPWGKKHLCEECNERFDLSALTRAHDESFVVMQEVCLVDHRFMQKLEDLSQKQTIILYNIPVELILSDLKRKSEEKIAHYASISLQVVLDAIYKKLKIPQQQTTIQKINCLRKTLNDVTFESMHQIRIITEKKTTSIAEITTLVPSLIDMCEWFANNIQNLSMGSFQKESSKNSTIIEVLCKVPVIDSLCESLRANTSWDQTSPKVKQPTRCHTCQFSANDITEKIHVWGQERTRHICPHCRSIKYDETHRFKIIDFPKKQLSRPCVYCNSALQQGYYQESQFPFFLFTIGVILVPYFVGIFILLHCFFAHRMFWYCRQCDLQFPKGSGYPQLQLRQDFVVSIFLISLPTIFLYWVIPFYFSFKTILLTALFLSIYVGFPFFLYRQKINYSILQGVWSTTIFSLCAFTLLSVFYWEIRYLHIAMFFLLPLIAISIHLFFKYGNWQNVISKAKSYATKRYLLHNKTAIFAPILCFPIFLMYGYLEVDIKNKRYYMEYIHAPYQKAVLMENKGKWKKALKLYEQILNSASYSQRKTFYQRVEMSKMMIKVGVLESEGKWEEALKLCKKVTSMDRSFSQFKVSQYTDHLQTAIRYREENSAAYKKLHQFLDNKQWKQAISETYKLVGKSYTKKAKTEIKNKIVKSYLQEKDILSDREKTTSDLSIYLNICQQNVQALSLSSEIDKALSNNNIKSATLKNLKLQSIETDYARKQGTAFVKKILQYAADDIKNYLPQKEIESLNSQSIIRVYQEISKGETYLAQIKMYLKEESWKEVVAHYESLKKLNNSYCAKLTQQAKKFILDWKPQEDIYSKQEWQTARKTLDVFLQTQLHLKEMEDTFQDMVKNIDFGEWDVVAQYYLSMNRSNLKHIEKLKKQAVNYAYKKIDKKSSEEQSRYELQQINLIKSNIKKKKNQLQNFPALKEKLTSEIEDLKDESRFLQEVINYEKENYMKQEQHFVITVLTKELEKYFDKERGLSDKEKQDAWLQVTRNTPKYWQVHNVKIYDDVWLLKPPEERQELLILEKQKKKQADKIFNEALQLYYFEQNYPEAWLKINRAITLVENPKFAAQKAKMQFLGFGTHAQDTAIETLTLLQSRLHKMNTDHFAQYILGWIAEEDIGKASNTDQAIIYYKRAVTLGNKIAANNLGFIYEQTRQYRQAITYYQIAAQHKIDNAAARLGVLFYSGKGVAVNYQKAYKYFQESIANGNKESMRNLGIMYFKGTGVKRNYDKAFELFSTAAKNQDPEACYYLAGMYYRGYSTLKSDRDAFYWYLEGAHLENVACMKNVALMYQNGIGVDSDNFQAEVWFNEYKRQKNKPPKSKKYSY